MFCFELANAQIRLFIMDMCRKEMLIIMAYRQNRKKEKRNPTTNLKENHHIFANNGVFVYGSGCSCFAIASIST